MSKDNSNNQPKSKYTLYSEKLFINREELKSFIVPASQKHQCICKFCDEKFGKDKSTFNVNNLKEHIRSDKHEAATPKNKKKELISLKSKYDEEENKKKSQIKAETNKKELKEKAEAKSYLEFLAFAMTENYSFSQISRLGKFLKNLHQSGFGFLQKYSFNEQEISNVATGCFWPHSLENLKEHLSSKPYSISVDASTICGENVFAIKAKYLEKSYDEELKEEITSVQNKIIRLSSFKESSKGSTMLEILEDKLFFNDQIKGNLVGISHDNAKSLVGGKIGLISLLNKETEGYFFDLRDPCHGLNLAVSNALDCLPEEIMTFVTDLHSHFVSPQRVALLKKIQNDNQMPIKKLKKYVKTRWLSLGISLDRLIEIWDSLKLYCDNIVQDKIFSEKKRVKQFCKLLKDSCFKLQIKYLCCIVNRVNSFNVILQGHSLPIERLKETIDMCYKTILRLIIAPEKINSSNLEGFTEINREGVENENLWILKDEEFTQLTSEINGFSELNQLKQEDKKKFSDIFKKFICKILNQLPTYLPISDGVLRLATFVDLRDEPAELEKKDKGI